MNCSKCGTAAATLTLADNGVLNVNRCTPCAKLDDEARAMVEARVR